MPLPSQDFLDGKTNATVALSSYDWDKVPAEIRQKAFLMAGVDDGFTLQAHRDAVRQILGGGSEADGLRALRTFLRETGYSAAAKDKGTIKDLATERRQKLVLDTNVSMAKNHAFRESMRGSLAFPALRLVRIRFSAKPRDWARTWAEAYASVGGRGAVVNPHVALLDSPIWVQLSRFGLPHPPFDYNSGMGVEPVGYDEALSLGLVVDEVEPAPEDTDLLPQREYSVDGMDGDILSSLAALEGINVDGSTLAI